MTSTKHLLWSTASLLCALALPAAQAAETRPVPVLNITAEAWVDGYIAEHSPQPLRTALQAYDRMGVVVDSWMFEVDGVRTCVAMTGVSQLTGRPRQLPRVPANVFLGASTAAARADGIDGCSGVAIRRALDQLFSTPDALSPDRLQMVLDASTGKRETRNTGHFVMRSGLSREGSDYIIEQLPGWVSRALNPLYVQSVAVYSRLETEDGSAVCFALHGFSARPAPDRLPRLPPQVQMRVKRYARQDAELARRDTECFDPMWSSLTGSLAPESDTIRNLVRDWASVAEPGAQAPSMKAVQAAYAAWLRDQDRALQRDRAAAARQRQVLSCTNDCVNGSCVRTLSDGRKERWQAPRRFNPLNNNWEWDITTNACGG